MKIVQNPQLREQFAKESLAIANTHDLQTTLARFEEIYSDLINA